MDLLKLQIDINQYDSVDGKDEVINLYFLGSYSIDGDQKTRFITDPDDPMILHSPSPCQYAILNKKHRSLKRMLEIHIEEMNLDAKDIYRSIKSNTKYPLIHLAVLTQSFKCLKILLKYLVKIRNSNLINQEKYEKILYMNDVTENHTPLFYSLFSFTSFKYLIEISEADPFRENIEGIRTSINNNTNTNGKDRRQVSVFAISFFIRCYTTNAIYTFLNEKMPEKLKDVLNNWKFDLRTLQFDNDNGKSFKEILDKYYDTLKPEPRDILTKLFPKDIIPIQNENISLESKDLEEKIEGKVQQRNDQSKESNQKYCFKCKKEHGTDKCPKCGQIFCQECLDIHNCTS